MHVLLTGSDGYIGTVMAPMLQAAGHTVVGLDTRYFGECQLMAPTASIAMQQKDVRDLTAADAQGFDAVVHLAALSNDPLGDLNDDWTYDINFRASVRLAELAKAAGVSRFVFASSCSIYGRSAADDMLSEEATVSPLTPYAISKVRTEEEVSNLADSGFSPVFMRNATAYGVSPRLRGDVVLNNLVLWAHTTGRVTIQSDGTPWRPIVHVEDISRAVVAALAAERSRIHNQAFNVGANAENYQVRDLAEIVRQTVPGSEVVIAGDGGPDPRDYRVDFSKIRRQLPEFQPMWTASQGARQLYDTFCEVGVTKADFEGRTYVRLRHLKYLLDSGRLNDTLRWTGAPPIG